MMDLDRSRKPDNRIRHKTKNVGIVGSWAFGSARFMMANEKGTLLPSGRMDIPYG